MNPTSILISGRDKAFVFDILNRINTHSTRKINTRVVSNGTVDPLEGLSNFPDLLILILSPIWKEELSALINRPRNKRSELIVIADERESEAMRLAMQAGARDFLSRAMLDSGLNESVEQIHNELQEGHEHKTGKLIAIMNSKGGSGASLLSANIAHILAVQENKDVALIDMDFIFAPLPAYFDVKPRHSLYDALNAAESDEMDISALRGYMTHHKSHVDILANTSEVIPVTWAISQESMNHLIDLALSSYDYVLIDLPLQLEPLTQLILERANNISLVIQQSIMHIRDAKRLMYVLSSELSIPETQINLILNRYTKKNVITLSDIENTLDINKLSLIPNDYDLASQSVDSGLLLYDLNPKAAITKAIIKLVEYNILRKIDPEGGFLSRVWAGLTGQKKSIGRLNK